MSSIFLFDIASQRSNWLSIRQAAVAGNIANANTPGYTAQDIQGFSAILDQTAKSDFAMARTSPAHLDVSGSAESADGRAWSAQDTEQPVALDKQLVLADETNRAFSLDTAIIRGFHRMFLAAVRST
jgi:flagellar basal-body rod protein FlgB